jgi:hypothetical protein
MELRLFVRAKGRRSMIPGVEASPRQSTTTRPLIPRRHRVSATEKRYERWNQQLSKKVSLSFIKKKKEVHHAHSRLRSATDFAHYK